MRELHLEGRARVIGDDINTDYIIASHRKRDSLDPQVLRHFLFETIDPAFAASIAPGDIIVAGKNFGCGSAMEVAATAVLGAGINAVLARSFARTYYRNAINNGLLPILCDTHGIGEGGRLTITVGDEVRVWDADRRVALPGEPIPQIMLDILAAGGIVPYLRSHRDFVI
ncbi:MAG TPA: alpha-IPM isomerase [Alphaproteobacteria bacterium]|nr:alpha-IPM isomerase [Alphaproteobacteria bacterium]